MNSILTHIIILSFSAAVASELADFFPLPQEQETATLHVSCDKKCYNSGTCIFDEDGTPSCSCPSGFFGNLCENEREACGENFCNHRSKCLKITLSDGSLEDVCDCSGAYTDNTHYAGEYCQYESTSFCSKSSDPNGRQFCVNNGECPEESHLPCICPSGFLGPRCAFQIGKDEGNYETCDLSCMNGGTCQQGLKYSQSNSMDNLINNLDHFLSKEEQQKHVDYKHCVCPEGFFGIRCEYEVEQCGESEHLCFHGSICVMQETEFACDCETSEYKSAGLFCEYTASSECEQWVDKGSGHRGFCTNGGTCEVDSNGAPSCICPSGYKGQHCEFRMSINDVDPYDSNEQDKNGLGVFGLIGISISAIAAIAGIAWIVMAQPKKEQSLSENKSRDHNSVGAASLPEGRETVSFKANDAFETKSTDHLPALASVDLL